MTTQPTSVETQCPSPTSPGEHPQQQPNASLSLPAVERTQLKPSPLHTEMSERIASAHNHAEAVLTASGVASESLNLANVRVHSVLYMTYWYHRLRNNPEEQERVKINLVEYIGTAASDARAAVEKILCNEPFRECASDYVQNLLLPVRTVDLVITRADGPSPDERYVLCQERGYYPFGPALPGGIIRDDDEGNQLGVSAGLFAALRVAGEKVLGGGEDIQYTQCHDEKGRVSYVVTDSHTNRSVVLHPEHADGYSFKENIRTVLRPSDPRHLVDTIGFRCELKGEPGDGLTWRSRPEVMSAKSPSGGFAFNHHREIISHIIARTSVEQERNLHERTFIRSIITEPLEAYTTLKEQIASAKNPHLASVPQLFPVVDRLLTSAYTPEINQLCAQHEVLAGLRDQATIALRQVSLKNRTFCPYVPTLHAISQSLAFFDVVERTKRGFYATMDKDRIVEHNPAMTKDASYHMYRYKYRFDELLCKVPDEIIIPTFQALSATDLMRVRCVPIRFIGLSTTFLYVDEFEQSPQEFMMHDANHSWRMVMEDEQCLAIYGRSREELIQESTAFSREYLDYIKVSPADSEEVREIKKLKKIILFEITHEDARPFLKDVICRYIQQKEGTSVPFEVPHIDPRTGYMDVVDTLDTGISTLSYVRNKLQHGFYDQTDAQMPQIVDPRYRTSEWIARAAYEMLVELGATPAAEAELDDAGHVSMEWLLKRVCSVGPDNIHEATTEDPLLEEYGDGGERLNPKRYQA